MLGIHLVVLGVLKVEQEEKRTACSHVNTMATYSLLSWGSLKWVKKLKVGA